MQYASNAVHLVDAIDWDVSYKDLINKVAYDSSNKECKMHRCKSCPEIGGFNEFLDEQLCDIDFNYSQWNTIDRTT